MVSYTNISTLWISLHNFFMVVCMHYAIFSTSSFPLLLSQPFPQPHSSPSFIFPLFLPLLSFPAEQLHIFAIFFSFHPLFLSFLYFLHLQRALSHVKYLLARSIVYVQASMTPICLGDLFFSFILAIHVLGT